MAGDDDDTGTERVSTEAILLCGDGVTGTGVGTEAGAGNDADDGADPDAGANIVGTDATVERITGSA